MVRGAVSWPVGEDPGGRACGGLPRAGGARFGRWLAVEYRKDVEEGPMAWYWRSMGVYSAHIARALR